MPNASVPRHELPPGPGLPSSLQTLRWVVRPTAFMEECRRRYGDCFTLRIASEGSWVLISDPESIKKVFTGNPEHLRAGEANVILRPVVGSESVLLLDGPSHLRQRKLLLPPFHGERMQRYGEVMREVTEREVATWPTGEPFPVWPRMQAITLEVIVRAVFGVDDAARVERVAGRIRPMLEFTSNKRDFFIAALVGPDRLSSLGWTGFPQAIGRVHEAIDEEIAQRRSDPHLDERDDILSMLLQARDEDGAPMTDRELRDELMTLLVAGHETTATSLAWTLERVVRHPEVLARLEDEAASGDGAYADAVSHEALRLRPVLPLVVRKLTEPLELQGYELPVGTTVAPCIYLVHRRPDVYPDPHAFRPERFLENPAGTYTWIPFGGGVRRCIGASFALFEMRTVLQTIVERLHLEAADPRAERISRRAITLSPARSAQLVVRPRVPASAAGRAPVAAAV
ncbi:MAG TPA: cytochrome P450 [Solirubrobacteraceae bacterium]|nr:cytochrome P450 [Solirubrobacteraceae bacterium]